jgi:hypothetical protein
MRLLAALAILLLAPLAQAGPIADSGLATHDEGCTQTHVEDATGYRDESACETSDAIAFDAAVARVEAREASSSGTTAHSEYAEDRHAQENRQHAIAGTYVDVEAGDARLSAADACEDSSSYEAEEDRTEGGDVDTWAMRDAGHQTDGCSTRVGAASGSDGIASAERFDGCRSASASEGTRSEDLDAQTYEQSSSGTSWSECGDVVTLAGADESATAVLGEQCRGEHTLLRSGSPDGMDFFLAGANTCTRGVSAQSGELAFEAGERTVAGTFCFVVNGQIECQQHEAPAGEGVWVRDGAEETHVPLPLAGLPGLP